MMHLLRLFLSESEFFVYRDALANVTLAGERPVGLQEVQQHFGLALSSCLPCRENDKNKRSPTHKAAKKASADEALLEAVSERALEADGAKLDLHTSSRAPSGACTSTRGVRL